MFLIKSCNDCIFSKPVDMQVYKKRKAPLITRFQALLTLFVVDVNVVKKNVPYTIKQNSCLCFALIQNVTLRVKGFRGKTPTLRGPERLGQPHHVMQNALGWRHLIGLKMCFH